jgi:hypothetical protein
LESKLTQEQQNPTPDDGGASTLDPLARIERMLAAEDVPDNQPESQDEGPADSVQSEEGATDDSQPQLTTTDLAKFLGVDENVLDLDEDGSVKFKAKIDGQERTAKLADVIKTYQIQGHAENRAREVAKQEEALRTRQQEAEQQFTQRLQYAENLTQVAANQLLQEFQSINWNALEQQDAGQAALWKQKFQERQAQLRGVYENIQREKANAKQKTDAETHESLRKEAERLPELIPEWKDAQVAAKERSEIRDWAIKAGYEPSEIDSISKAHHVAMLRKAMLADRISAQKPAIEAKVRAAPKLVKPGQAPQNTQEQSVRNLKQAVQKSGGKSNAVEAYLLATGRV